MGVISSFSQFSVQCLHAGKLHAESQGGGGGVRAHYLFARTKYKAFVFG